MRNLQNLRHQYEKLSSDLTALIKRHEGIVESLKRKPAQVLADEIAKLQEVFKFFKYFYKIFIFRKLRKQKL